MERRQRCRVCARLISGPVAVRGQGEDRSRTLAAGSAIHAGDEVISGGSGAQVRLRDGSMLDLSAHTTVRIDHGRITMRSGRLVAEVVPQPPQEHLLFVTDHITVTVIGTRLSISRTAQATCVGVEHGVVEIASKSAAGGDTGLRVRLVSGEVAIGDSGGLRTHSLLPPAVLSFDFTRGVPPGWADGNARGTPGSGGMRPVADGLHLGNTLYLIHTPKRPAPGTVAFGSGSILRLRLHVERGHHLDVILPFIDALTGEYLGNGVAQAPLPGPGDHELEIPYSAFVGLPAGLRCGLESVVVQCYGDDCGLVLYELAISPGSP